MCNTVDVDGCLVCLVVVEVRIVIASIVYKRAAVGFLAAGPKQLLYAYANAYGEGMMHLKFVAGNVLQR